jgi:uncharacterized protein
LIAYFDTSAVVPLLIEEVGTPTAAEFWERADRLVSVALVRVEARAALAQASRLGRITPHQLRTANAELVTLVEQLDLLEVDESLTIEAGDVAEERALRAYDAIHLAAAQRARDADLVLVAGDRALLEAARATGIATAALP